MVRARMRVAVAVAAATLGGLPLLDVGGASASTGVLDLELNEGHGARTAVDSSGHHHNGSIGRSVSMRPGRAHFPLQASSASLGAAPLVLVPDAADGSLDPGTGNFTVRMRFRTTHGGDLNVVQKGQAHTRGGQFKMALTNGVLRCTVKTSAGVGTAASGSARVTNGYWHRVSCMRTATSVTMYVDGRRTGYSSHHTGKLNNSWPWSIGGKPQCNGGSVDCDYFVGDIGYVRMTKG
jgi:concanavalin A-like lectin/glucanase superfamily protein